MDCLQYFSGACRENRGLDFAVSLQCGDYVSDRSTPGISRLADLHVANTVANNCGLPFVSPETCARLFRTLSQPLYLNRSRFRFLSWFRFLERSVRGSPKAASCPHIVNGEAVTVGGVVRQ